MPRSATMVTWLPGVGVARRRFPAALGPELARLGISGSAVDDALVGSAARQHGRSLVSGDARARPIYEALGVRVRLIG